MLDKEAFSQAIQNQDHRYVVNALIDAGYVIRCINSTPQTLPDEKLERGQDGPDAGRVKITPRERETGRLDYTIEFVAPFGS